MKNYDVWMTELFKTTLEEVEKLPTNHKHCMKSYRTNLSRVQGKFGQDVLWFSLKNLPDKRSPNDSACLLVFQRDDGQFWAKRHNNSQFFSLSY